MLYGGNMWHGYIVFAILTRYWQLIKLTATVYLPMCTINSKCSFSVNVTGRQINWFVVHVTPCLFFNLFFFCFWIKWGIQNTELVCGNSFYCAQSFRSVMNKLKQTNGTKMEHIVTLIALLLKSSLENKTKQQNGRVWFPRVIIICVTENLHKGEKKTQSQKNCAFFLYTKSAMVI